MISSERKTLVVQLIQRVMLAKSESQWRQLHPFQPNLHVLAMDGNKDEALRCLSISQKHRNSQNYPSARKFALKSISLFETPEARKLLETIESEQSNSSASTSGSTASGSEPNPPQNGAKHRQPFRSDSSSSINSKGKAPETEKREYTSEQVATVRRVKNCKVTEYYEILSVKKDCEETEVKKAYRKVLAHNMLQHACLAYIALAGSCPPSR